MRGHSQLLLLLRVSHPVDEVCFLCLVSALATAVVVLLCGLGEQNKDSQLQTVEMESDLISFHETLLIRISGGWRSSPLSEEAAE